MRVVEVDPDFELTARGFRGSGIIGKGQKSSSRSENVGQGFFFL